MENTVLRMGYKGTYRSVHIVNENPETVISGLKKVFGDSVWTERPTKAKLGISDEPKPKKAKASKTKKHKNAKKAKEEEVAQETQELVEA